MEKQVSPEIRLQIDKNIYRLGDQSNVYQDNYQASSPPQIMS